MRDGQVVFLLDALDQADEKLNEAGLRSFLQSAGVDGCRVLITLRPEVEGSAVFTDAVWDTIRAEGFHDEVQQRQYLGDAADELLVKEDEEWEDRASFERKQGWADLLEIPLLLKMLRALAVAQRDPQSQVSLADLHNRHAVYRQAVTHLVRKGLESLRFGPFRKKLFDDGEVNDLLTEIAWATIAQWEYAARAGTTTRYWWGDEFDPSKCPNGDSGLPHTLPPDLSRSNPWGLIDMLGNVWEWCLDGLRNYTEEPQADPRGPCESGSYRVYRAGELAEPGQDASLV